MSERQHRLPLLIDTGALAIGEYAVLDIDYSVVRVFETEEEAEAFVTKENGCDVETVRRATRERGRMVAEYRENLIRRSRERRQPLNRGTALPSTITVSMNIAAGWPQRAASFKEGRYVEQGPSTMCELLGLAFNKPISPGLSFRGFRRRAQHNRHGWGLAAVTSTKAVITKEPIRADQGEASRSLRDDPALIAPVFIGHVRAASCGDVNLQNTHPFSRRINGSDFVFAHNGTLKVKPLRARVDDRFPVEGSTDSELAMCVLLSWMARERVDPCNFPLIEDFLKTLNAAGNLNLLFSDGKRLYCYHDTGGYNGLCYTHRRSPFCRVSLRDEDWEADLCEEKSPHQRGFVIASHKLTDGEEWHEFRPGSLMVFEGGDLAYGTLR